MKRGPHTDPERDRAIYRYWLEAHERMTLKGIGKIFRISGERVRQIVEAQKITVV